MIFPAETWIFPVRSWMMNRKIYGMKMRRITITVLKEMVITFWMRIRMIYRYLFNIGETGYILQIVRGKWNTIGV